MQRGLQLGTSQQDIAQTIAARLQRPLHDVQRRIIGVYDALTAELTARFGLQSPHPVGVHPQMRERRAGAHGIATLYRYRPMRDEAELDRACGEALLGRFYFPTRAQLQDDLDLRLQFVMSDKKKARDWLREHTPFSVRTDAEKAKIDAQWDDESFLASVLDEFNTKFAAKTCKPFGAICFTTGGDTDPKFWNEYAGNHSGVCIHWDARTSPLSDALKVAYSDDAHQIEVTDESTLPFVELMLRKRTSYDWEMEYRILYLPRMFAPVKVDKDRLTHFHPRSIVGITFGADVRPEYRREFLLCIEPQIPATFEEHQMDRIFRADVPPLYQAFRDAAGGITVKPFSLTA